ncbi:hypothetical protein MPDQ_001855 [Monascus purpureus]|uniref:Fanconi-associated nuclease n=1 Tax=Monascus purpureus TaxID=5098 RepID=A0A507QQP5_MONPU|nr:hypothetical protein MPDQ_001855 [Monascus purpureus]
MSLLEYWGTQRTSAKRRKTVADHVGIGNKSGQSHSGISSNNAILKSSETSVGRYDGNEESSQTELENSLPDIGMEKYAIEHYGAAYLEEQVDEQSLDQIIRAGRWRKGRSSVYVDAFNLALETVLAEEAHLFDEAEIQVFRQWRSLSYEAQYLYVRLFLRKTSAWHRVNRLAYDSDITDLPRAVIDLRLSRSLLVCPKTLNDNPADTDMNTANSWGNDGYFQFAEDIRQITTLEEASSLLLLDELRVIAKENKVQGKTKKELLSALRRASQTQMGLSWNDDKGDGQRSSRDSYLVQKILDYTGDCIRLTSGSRILFERVHLVSYRSTEWTEKSLTAIILAKTSRRNFPEYVVCRSSSIFPSRATLLEFESALRMQFEIDNILEFNGTPTTVALQRIRELADKVYSRWKILLEQEQRKEEGFYERSEGAYLRRFSPVWVYTRIIHKGLHPLARFKEHEKEHCILTELLTQRLFHAARRGAWYQRKALLEEHYMWSLTPFDGLNEEAQRKHWKRVALRTCEEGLEDPECHLIYHYDLQKRITKLEKSLRVVKREQHDFGYAMLTKPEERVVEGIRIAREDPPGQNVPRRSNDIASRRSHATVWIDEKGTGEECRVENMCLGWYRVNGWKGHHSEDGIVRTLFGYLFYDILFTYVPNVFQTPFQTCPLDLHTDAFYATRASEINHRLVEISNGATEKIIRAVHERESPRRTCVIGIDWSFELDDLVEIAQCFHGAALAIICKVLAQEYQQRGSGIPDLFLWNVVRKEVMFVEVKSENDRLSDTQRLWIHILLGAGVKVELCNAVAR